MNVIFTEMEKKRLKEIIAVVNNKGGVAKTTTVQSLAAGILRSDPHLKILVVDLDPQANLSMLCGFNAEKQENARTVYDALRKAASIPVYKTEKGIYYSPSSPELQTVDADLFRQMQPKKVLGACFAVPVDDHTGDGLGLIIDSFDYVFIDCPPALSEVTYNAMAIASGLLIPVQAEGLSISGLGSIITEMGRVQHDLNPGLELRGVLPVMLDARPKIVKGFIDYLQKAYAGHICNTMIRRCIKINEAQTQLQDIFSWSPYCSAALDYEKLIKELFGDLKKTRNK